MTDIRRGDVVLVAFPFMTEGALQRKRRPAVVVQADRYNRRRAAVIIAAITTTRAHRDLPSKVVVRQDTMEGRQGGLRLDSVIDCQTLATLPRQEVVATLGRFPQTLMDRLDVALSAALGLTGPKQEEKATRRPAM